MLSLVSVGHTKFGSVNDDIGKLMFDASYEALGNARTNMDSVDAIYIANFSSRFTDECHLPAVLASEFNVNKEIIRVESACASGGVALKEAAIAIQSGLYDSVLVVGVEKMTSKPIDDITSILATAGSNEEMSHGATFPSLYALMARRYIHEYGATEEHLAKIAVKNHENALHNPVAQFHKRISVNDVLKSRVIASPIKLFDCSPISDGAAAVLICNNSTASKYTDTPVHLMGIGHDVEPIELFKRRDLDTMPTVIRASRKAFQMSGLKPKDIDVAELHDCFTIAELIEMEDLGFCGKGEGKKMIDEERTTLTGNIPINPSGGLKAKGHPVGATGVSQVVEIFKQLRGECEKRQVDDAEFGLCCNVGGVGGTCVVSIFSR